MSDPPAATAPEPAANDAPQPLDADRPARWRDAEGGAGTGERPAVERLTGGSQNELFSLSRAGQRTVLRMPPVNAGASRADGLRRDYHVVLANWKLAVVLEKGYASFVRGDQVDPKVETFGPLVLRLLDTAARLARTLPTRGRG